MSRSTTSRQLAKTLFSATSQSSSTQIRCAAAAPLTRPFSSSSTRRDDGGKLKRESILSGVMGNIRNSPTANNDRQSPFSSPPFGSGRSAPVKSENMWKLSQRLPSANLALGRATNDTRFVDSSLLDRDPSGGLDDLSSGAMMADQPTEPYHFHIYSHKHNCHVTVTKPNRDAIVSLSCGNLGFRKSQRKTYDSAYQLGAYVIDKLQQAGWHNKIDKMEVSLRGFGPGREAVTKVLLGTEGKLLRDKIVKVSDSTRLKFGGTRSKRPRRLG